MVGLCYYSFIARFYLFTVFAIHWASLFHSFDWTYRIAGSYFTIINTMTSINKCCIWYCFIFIHHPKYVFKCRYWLFNIIRYFKYQQITNQHRNTENGGIVPSKTNFIQRKIMHNWWQYWYKVTENYGVTRTPPRSM